MAKMKDKRTESSASADTLTERHIVSVVRYNGDGEKGRRNTMKRQDGVFMTIGDAAKRLGVTARIVSKLAKAGRLTGCGFGAKQTRIRYVTCASVERLAKGEV